MLEAVIGSWRIKQYPHVSIVVYVLRASAPDSLSYGTFI